MERLRSSTYNTIQQELESSEEEQWANVNISMKPSLVKVIDTYLEEEYPAHISRSKFVRVAALEKIEAETGGEQ